MHSSSLTTSINLTLCAPWRWYTCTETCRRYSLNIYTYLLLLTWLVQ